MNNIKNLGINDLEISVNKLSLQQQLEKYKEYMENEKSFHCTFSLYNRKKDFLYTFDNDVRIQMSKDTYVGADNQNFALRYLPYLPKAKQPIGKDMSVNVVSIDEQHGIVYVLPSYLNSKKRTEVVNAIQNSLNKDEPIRVPAQVIGFTGVDPETHEKNKSVVLLDIANLGIMGSIRVQNWSISHVTSPGRCVEIGDVIEVAVTGVAKWQKGCIFDCSRKLIMEQDHIEPWKGIEQRLPKHTELELLCVEKRAGNFFSMVKGIQDIEILCEYPDIEECEIFVGNKYRGYVTTVDEKKKKLCARIIGEVEVE